MKALLLILIVLPTMSFAQEFNALAERPKILELKKIRPASGQLELRYVHEGIQGTPRVVVRTIPNSKEVKEVYEAVLEAEDVGRIYCDGDYFANLNPLGVQYIHVNAIKVCVDDEGEVVVHSVGISPKLTPAQIAASVQLISENRKSKAADTKVNDRHTAKSETSTSGVFSGRLGGKSVSK
jgi:hypothetical protein